MNRSQWSRSRQLCPIGCPGQPFQIVSEEGVVSGAAVHEAIGNHSGRVAGGNSEKELFSDQFLGNFKVTFQN